MGLKISKPGPEKAGNMTLVLQHRTLTYLTASSFIRNLVSKKRRRMVVGGYDLDMSHITDNLLAMSFPAERMRAMYRNPLMAGEVCAGNETSGALRGVLLI
ncbi:hypothetical protein DITRI_Ditri09bG0052500 [Diplodiscus trichospermus]